MRLAHVWSSHFGAALGLPLIRPFVERGWDVSVFCPDGDLVANITAAGIHHEPITVSRRFVDPVRDAFGVAKLGRRLRRGRYDLIHTHNIKVGWLARLVGRVGTRARIVHTVHGVAFADDASGLVRGIEARAERTAARFCDRVLVQSNDDAQSLLNAGVSPRKLVFIGNGVDLTRFDPAAVDPAAARASMAVDPAHVLFVSAGRLVREKGFLELATAGRLAREHNPNIRVAIAGPMDPRSRLALTSTELAQLETDALLLGQRADMPQVLAAADAVALVSRHEGLPRVLMEGAAMAKPLLATNARGCREVVNDPRGGALIPPGDTAALAHAMVDLANDPDRRANMGRHNRTMAEQRFNITTVFGRLDRVYAELIG